MSLSGPKNELSILRDTESDQRRLKKSVLARRGFAALKPPAKILCITFWDKPFLAGTSSVLLSSFRMAKDFRSRCVP